MTGSEGYSDDVDLPATCSSGFFEGAFEDFFRSVGELMEILFSSIVA